MGNLDQQPRDGTQQLHDRLHPMGYPHDLWVDGQRLVELLELYLPSNRAKQEGRVPTSHTPSMAQHPKSMVEVYSRPTTFTSLGSKNIEHLRGLLAVLPLRNIAGSPRKGTSSSGNLSEKVSHRRDNESSNSRDSPTAQAHLDSSLHRELYLGNSHKVDTTTTAETCHNSST